MPRFIAALAFAALALAACGGGSDGSEQGQSGEPGVVEGFRVLKTIEIHETDFAFEPSTIRVGEIAIYGLKIVNDGDVAHSFEISGPKLHRKIGAIQPGESTTIAVFFRERGDYDFICPIDDHAEMGMQGVITVGPR